MDRRTAYAYLLRCADGTLYAGWTFDPAGRLAAHSAGRGAKYTRARLPVRLAYLEACGGKSAAMRREAALKRLSRAEKLALCAGWEQNRAGEPEPSDGGGA